MPSLGRNGVAEEKEGDMLDHFNAASLATLSKAELHALLANYQAKLFASSDNLERAQLRSDISMVQRALELGS